MVGKSMLLNLTGKLEFQWKRIGMAKSEVLEIYYYLLDRYKNSML